MQARRTVSTIEPGGSVHAAIQPLEKPIAAERQAARRHYGVHPYFTRRPFNVVRRYILQYSKEGDRVLDPFGGSGVTAIEAFLENRIGIQNDINPLANFIARGIVGLAEGTIEEYRDSLGALRNQCREKLNDIQRMDDTALATVRRNLLLPPNVRLPSNADVERYHDLFSTRQLVSLAVLRQAVDNLPTGPSKQAMLIAWSATLTKLNKTFLSAEGRSESRGGSSIFSIYRYKIARRPIELPPWETFEERAKNVIAAKLEIDKTIEIKKRTEGWRGVFEEHAEDIAELKDRFRGQIDYIFTDPPYGGHISYLDLSTLWNVWLNQNPTKKAREMELIVGGELKHSEGRYIERLSDSIRDCVTMLKQGRWMSVVFQHWKVAYFDAILTSASHCGAELRAAISQVGDPIWSMHKKKRNESVLAGELILTFYKTGEPCRVHRNGDFDVSQSIGEILASNRTHIFGESLFNRVVLEAWNKSAIGALDISKTDFIEIVKKHGWHYDEKNHYWVRDTKSQQSLFN